jgi:hypothetical protein
MDRGFRQSSRASGTARAGLLALAASACAVAAHAQEPGVQWQAAAEVRHRTLTEWADSGTKLLTERGPIARVELSATLHRTDWPTLMVRGALAQGRLDYEGQDQGGVPLTTASRHSEWEAGLHWRPAASSAWGEAWLGVDWLRQRRDIAPTPLVGGLRETSAFVLPGARWRSAAFSLPMLPALEFRFEAQWRTSASHRLSVDYLGAYDSSAFDSGHRDEAALRLIASGGSGWRWTLGFSHVRQASSDNAVLRSGGAALGTVREPAIRIADVSLAVAREF